MTGHFLPGVLLAAGLTAFSAQANLVLNPGFELGNTTVDHWLNEHQPIPADGSKTPGSRHTQISIVNLDGNRALLLESDGNDDAFALVRIPRLPVLKGFNYEVTFQYRAEGLQPESVDRSRYAALIMDLFVDQEGKGNVGGCRIMTSNNSAGWATLKRNNRHSDFFTIPEVPGKVEAQIRFQLVNKYPDNPVRIWIDNVEFLPLDTPLANPGFEDGTQTPERWSTIGAARTEWVTTPVKSGKRAVAVSDAPDGLFSGWTTVVPVRPDRQYRFSGWIKGGKLNPNGFIGGGALQLEFLDKNGNAVGKVINSAAVPANTDWTEAATPFTTAPEAAVAARLTAGLRYCNGTAWFDDLSLDVRPAQVGPQVLLKRVAQPAPGVRFSTNLLTNGDLEQGKDGKVTGWTYHGRSDRDWTKEEIQKFHDDGRPTFSVGRGRGVWTADEKYAGERSLLNISIDPPLSSNHQWYGRNPVDGYWLSDPMKCEPGKAYLAAGWIKPGALLEGTWYGPLHLLFYDRNGRELAAANHGKIRAAQSGIKPGEWVYWGTVPYVAPEGAATMRLRFGQELKADNGGWGMTYADNLAVWASPAGPDSFPEATGNNRAYREWFMNAHRDVKPPYLPAPTEAPAYESSWGRARNTVDGNLFSDPAEPVRLKLQLFNQLGETRKLKISALRTDAYGNAAKPVQSPEFEVPGSSTREVEIELPPTNAYGAFHVDCDVYEQQARVGSFSARYAVLPELKRPHTVDNPFGVTTLYFDPQLDNPHLTEMGRLLRKAGFGKVWIRFQADTDDPERFARDAEPVLREIEFFRRYGLETLLNMYPVYPQGDHPRPLDREKYFRIGQLLGRTFGGKVLAIGNHGIEQANSKSPYRGGGKSRLTDEEYDTMMAQIYDGIKSVNPEQLVCIGNIATDFEADTVKRLYRAPGNGKFDGAFFNAYMGQLTCAQNMVKEFDAHGDTHKDVWSEEQANQRSPFEGEARRYGEIEGATNMVRTWASLLGKMGRRLRVVTIWGFAPSTAQDIMMMTPELQPRPQYVAHAIMADFLADAELTADRSTEGISLFEWKRSDGPAFIGWADAGKRVLTLEVPSGKLTVTDLMGNAKVLTARNGLVLLELDSTPVFLSGGGAVTVSDRVHLTAGDGTRRADRPELAVRIQNNSGGELRGTLTTDLGKVDSITLAGGEEQTYRFPLKSDVSANRRSAYRATFTGSDGAVFAAGCEFNHLPAVKVAAPPALDGSWKGWERARVISFGEGSEVRVSPYAVGESYTGKEDLHGRFRLLWDEQYLYLGVESEDDVFLPQRGRGSSGFMGDSIEFAFQPEGIFKDSAPKYEFEQYLPLGETAFVLSRRFPPPAGRIDDWRGCVKATGKRGNAVYQLAIPWSALDTRPATGKRLGFALLLNDKDNPEAAYSGARNSIAFFGGINGKNPAEYGDLILVE